MTSKKLLLAMALIAMACSHLLKAQGLVKVLEVKHTYDFSRYSYMYRCGDGIGVTYTHNKGLNPDKYCDFINKDLKVVHVEKDPIGTYSTIRNNKACLLSMDEKELTFQQFDFETGQEIKKTTGTTIKKSFENAGVKLKQIFNHDINGFDFQTDDIISVKVHSRSADGLKEFHSIFFWNLKTDAFGPIIPNAYPQVGIENEAKRSANNGWAFHLFTDMHLIYSKHVYNAAAKGKTLSSVYYISKFNIEGNHETPFMIDANIEPEKYTLTEIKLTGTTYEAPGSFIYVDASGIYTLSYAYETADPKKKPVMLLQKTDFNGKKVWNSVFNFYEKNKKDLLKFSDSELGVTRSGKLFFQIRYASSYFEFPFDSKTGEPITEKETEEQDPNTSKINAAVKKETADNKNIDGSKEADIVKLGPAYFIGLEGKNNVYSIYEFRP